MKTLGTNVLRESLRQHNTAPWIWLYEIELEATTISAPTARLTSFADEVVWNGKTFYPFPITHEPIRQDTAGDLPQTTITLSNATREFVRYLETADGMIGNPVSIHLTHQAIVATGEGCSWEFEIKGSVANSEIVGLRLEMPEFYRIAIPMDLFTPNRCRWRYKGAECGYRGGIVGCDKTLNGSNGCVVHGADEAANGRPVMHPARYGAFPGLLRNVR